MNRFTRRADKRRKNIFKKQEKKVISKWTFTRPSDSQFSLNESDSNFIIFFEKFKQHAVEIVKNLQRLQGIDGDYDNDSGSGPDRIARRRTVHNLEKASKPRRQIGTLDVAFKKRFLKLTADENNPSEFFNFWFKI